MLHSIFFIGNFTCMNTGKRNRRITIVTPGVSTPDGYGGFIEGTPTMRDTWCSARQLSMNESLLYGLETSTANYIFGFTYYSVDDVKRASELIYEGRNFRIKGINEIDEAKKAILITATERL